MKLYYAPGACSLAPHIVAHETGIALDLEKVDTKTKALASGGDFRNINPKGYVPALRLDDGSILTEGPVVSQYLADLHPESGLAPLAGSLERYRLLEWLGYINSEIHKNYSALFDPTTRQETRQEKTDYLRKRYDLIEQRLATNSFLLGERYTIADIYLFVVTNWSRVVKMDLSDFPNLLAFQKRVVARPAVQAALKAEGLVK
jgi:glutathione S-transferase